MTVQSKANPPRDVGLPSASQENDMVPSPARLPLLPSHAKLRTTM
jgi:hypothetical protein